MKKKTLLIIALAFLIVKLCFSQNKYLGINGSVGFDIYELYDSKSIISAFPALSPSWGINAGYVINDAFHIETGLNKKDCFFSYGLFGNKSSQIVTSNNTLKTLQISSKLISRLYLYDSRFYLTCRLGLRLGFILNSSNNYVSEQGVFFHNNVSIKNTNVPTERILFPLLESGLGLDFRMYKNTFLFFTTNYHSGFRNINIVDIDYTAFNYEHGKATGISKGSFWETLAGFKFFFR